MSFRRVKGYKIKAARKTRQLSLQDVVNAAGGQISKSSLWQWETGYKNAEPTNDKIPELLRALNCTFEEISEPVEVALSA